jgi:hypothetical protein
VTGAGNDVDVGGGYQCSDPGRLPATGRMQMRSVILQIRVFGIGPSTRND